MTFAEEHSKIQSQAGLSLLSVCMCVRAWEGEGDEEQIRACESNFVYKTDIFHDICWWIEFC